MIKKIHEHSVIRFTVLIAVVVSVNILVHRATSYLKLKIELERVHLEFNEKSLRTYDVLQDMQKDKDHINEIPYEKMYTVG